MVVPSETVTRASETASSLRGSELFLITAPWMVISLGLQCVASNARKPASRPVAPRMIARRMFLFRFILSPAVHLYMTLFQGDGRTQDAKIIRQLACILKLKPSGCERLES